MVLENYQQKKFISDDQDNAVDYILGLAGKKDAPGYTSDVNLNEKLSLSDILGYFSSYPEFQKKLGLWQTASFDKSILTGNGILELECREIHVEGISYRYHKVHFEIKETRGNIFFFPISKTAGKYADGYLNLGYKKSAADPPQYGLFQNSFQEMKHRDDTSCESQKKSDTTNGLFLIQADASVEVKARQPDEELFLEDLVQGYRVDVLRKVAGTAAPKQYSWKSLHQRTCTFNIGGMAPLKDDAEGFISANSVTKAFELLRSADSTEINISTLVAGTSREYDLVVPDNVYAIHLTVVCNSGGGVDYSVASETDAAGNKITKPVLTVWKPNASKDSADPAGLAALVKAVNDVLTLRKAALMERLLQVDNAGRLYYGGVGDDATASGSPSYLPSSLICHINGYSLSAPKYMGTMLTDYFTRVDNNVPPTELEAFMRTKNIHLEVICGGQSLPIIRIGDTYRVRCRLALIGGIGLLLSDDNQDYCLERLYQRQDPIPAPKLLFSTTGKDALLPKLGDTEIQLIIRQQAENTKAESASRLIAPPSAGWQLAEWMKMMDNGDKPDPGIMNQVVKFDDVTKTSKMPFFERAGTYLGTPAVRWVPRTGRFMDYVAPGAPIPYIIDKMAEYFVIEPVKLHSLHHVVNVDFNDRTRVENAVKVAYLKELNDMRNRFSLKFFPNGPVCAFWAGINDEKRTADKNLPLWKLEIVRDPAEGEAHVQITPADKTVHIYLAPGDDIEFVIRCFTKNDNHLKSLYYLENDTDRNKIKDGKNVDKNYLVCAEQRFRAIYARQNPKNPQLDNVPLLNSNDKQQFEVYRDAGFADEVLLRQGLLYTGKSCGDVYLMAEWHEIIDDAEVKTDDQSPLRVVTHYKKVFSYSDAASYSFNNADRIKTLNFGDNGNAPESDSPVIVSIGKLDDENCSDKDAQPNRIYANIQGRNLAFRHPLGSTKFHSIRYRLAGTSRFTPYFEDKNPEVYNSFYTGWVKNLNNPKVQYLPLMATKEPDVPKVAFMVPLFDTQVQPGLKTERQFKGIRIYLERPWYSSGYGEELAIIVALNNPPPGDFTNYVTQIGPDVTSLGNVPQNEIYFNSTKDRQMPLPGKDGDTVGVKIAAFPVSFDRGQNRWFADVSFDELKIQMAYTPFIRLVVARHQPHSVPGKELSLPIACDFIQIYPNRTLSIVKGGLIKMVASHVKQGRTKETPLSEVWFWPVERNLNKDANGSYLVEKPEKLESPHQAQFNGEEGTFSIPYTVGKHKTIIVREFETYANNTDTTGVSFAGRRLLYSHVIKLP